LGDQVAGRVIAVRGWRVGGFDDPQAPAILGAERQNSIATVDSGATSEGVEMKIVLIGGTGLIGSKLVATLNAEGHDTVAASLCSLIG
jgi:hypothetical protein